MIEDFSKKFKKKYRFFKLFVKDWNLDLTKSCIELSHKGIPQIITNATQDSVIGAPLLTKIEEAFKKEGFHEEINSKKENYQKLICLQMSYRDFNSSDHHNDRPREKWSLETIAIIKTKLHIS